jgi:amidase
LIPIHPRSPPLKLAELIEREFGGFVPPKMFDD